MPMFRWSTSSLIGVVFVLSTTASLHGCTRVRQASAWEQGSVFNTADALAPDRDPFHLNPVTWRYYSVESEGDEIISDVFIAMTTTRERQRLEQLGLMFKLVVELQGAGPESSSRGNVFDGGYVSIVGLMTSSGLFTTRPGETETNLETDADEIAELSTSGEAAWPLGNGDGCRQEEANVRLSFGTTRGVVTRCNDHSSHVGRADVTTVWVDQVGFAYRRADPVNDMLDPEVYTDYLVAGDLLELAPPPRDGDAPVLDFRPPVAF